jgi:hypothetical protein
MSWRSLVCRGFYRGFGTVVFGTIPARSVYLTTLEVTKATVTKLGERFDISAPALAGAASFVGGAAASASTQAVVVPIDVISQRLMMQGVPGSSSSSSSSSRPQGQQPLQQQQQQQQQQRQPLQQAAGNSSSSTSSTSSSSSSRPVGSAAAVPSQPAGGAASAGAPPQQPGTRSVHTSSSSSSRSSRQRLGLTQQQQQQTALQQHSQHSTAASRQHSPLHQRLVQQPYSAAIRQCSSTAAAQPMNGFHMARLIVQQEGVRGLYRGFWPSLATFVPNSALWWGAYGFWQRFLWEQMPQGSTAQPAAAAGKSSSISSSRGPSTGMVVAVQTTAAVLSGCTASVLTNPLDLVKTRLQVGGWVGGYGECLLHVGKVASARVVLMQEWWLCRGLILRSALEVFECIMQPSSAVLVLV